MIMMISAVMTLFLALGCHNNPILGMAEAQDDPKLASIKKRISKTTPLLVFEPNNPVFRRSAPYTKSHRFKARRVKVVEEGGPSGRRLFTTVGRHKYFIDDIQGNGAGTLPEAIVDPTGSYIAYASGTGCGYEGDGTTTFISDVYGKKPYPIFGGAPEKFVEYEGRLYLLLGEGNGASNEDNAFSLYDVRARKYVVRAKGDITEIRKGVFSYGYYPEGDEIKPVGIVTMKNLINRERPLLLLPRSSPGSMMTHPTYRLTRRKNTKMFLAVGDNECCVCCEKDKYEVIPKARTRVLILLTCDEGGYQVYYKRQMGKVKKEDLQSIK